MTGNGSDDALNRIALLGPPQEVVFAGLLLSIRTGQSA